MFSHLPNKYCKVNRHASSIFIGYWNTARVSNCSTQLLNKTRTIFRFGTQQNLSTLGRRPDQCALVARSLIIQLWNCSSNIHKYTNTHSQFYCWARKHNWAKTIGNSARLLPLLLLLKQTTIIHFICSGMRLLPSHSSPHTHTHTASTSQFVLLLAAPSTTHTTTPAWNEERHPSQYARERACKLRAMRTVEI